MTDEQILKKIKSFWQLTRLGHGFMLSIAVVIGALIVGNVFLKVYGVLLGVLAAILIEAGTFSLNDYYDIEVDRENERLDRPLVRGDIKPKTAFTAGVILTVIGVACAYFINNWCFLIALLSALFGVAYDIKLKETGFLGNIYIAYTMAIPFLFGGMIFQNVEKGVLVLIVLSLITFLSGLGREIMKGIIDVKGDSLREVKTVARVYGIKKARIISITFFSMAVALSPIPFIYNLSGFRNYPYLVFVLIADIIFIYSCIKLKSGDKEVINGLRKTTIMAMLFGLIAFFSGAAVNWV